MNSHLVARLLAASLLWGGLSFPVAADDNANLAPNPGFTAGRDGPSGWKVASGRGRWADRAALQIEGSGHEAEYWQSEPIRFEPGRDYRFEARARRLGGTGSLIAGPEFVNRDYIIPTGDWQLISHVFRVPDTVTSGVLRLGVWNSSGTVQFDTVRVVPVQPVYQASENLRLGAGESVLDGRYTFSGTYGQEGSNDHRPLVAATAGFNSDRWTVSGPGRIVYRFGLPGHPFVDAKVTVGLSHHVRGSCVVEVGADGRSWRTAATLDHVGTARAKLPGDLFPSSGLFIRVRTDAPASSFQVNELSLEAGLQGQTLDAIGSTTYAEVSGGVAGLAPLELALSTSPSGNRTLELVIENNGNAATTLLTAGEIRSAARPAHGAQPVTAPPTSLMRSSKATVHVMLPPVAPGPNELTLRLQEAGKGSVTLTLPYAVADFERDDYGQRIAGVDGPTAVWWCDATHKIPRQCSVPAQRGVAAVLSAARNDHEAVQIVVRPTETLKNLTATLAGLSGPAGATIAPARVHLLREHYHFVHHPTDASGVRGWWPDALPPLARPIDVAAGTNQPLWVLVDVPADVAAGDYAGTLALKADGWAADVPLRLHVWKFTLPVHNHLETAFGFSPHEVFRYHNIRTEADRRTILDLYFQSFAEHRISPYDPAPLDPIRVTFRGEADPPRAELDWSAYDVAMEHALATYHFTNFQLNLQGMGGGTFASREEPSIGRYHEGSPQYQALFSSYVRQLSDHLRSRGWTKAAYVYWFDEPEPKDYAFVRAGMARIKKFGPDIPRMLTEEPGPELAGSVDIWCPLTPNYNLAQADSFRARGDRFWWYVCTGPKTPYCTLFIDHPATELRVWLWQTWQNKVAGNLVWATNWWTSPTAFPDAPQNPYDDPMSYTDGYGLPRGTRAYWGNGDGRFFYPPESAATPGLNGSKPVLEPPVSSLRWEMLREGVEDYEFLHLLSDLLARRREGLDSATVKHIEALLDVPQTISRDMTTFTTDPAPIYARRAEIARAIEELMVEEGRPVVKIVEGGESRVRPEDCLGTLVGPGINQPDPFPGYGGFVGWVSPIRLKNGDWIVGFNAGYWHASAPTPLRFSPRTIAEFRKIGLPAGVVAPTGGRALIMRSSDEGKTWSNPMTLLDTPDDDRHPAFIELPDGTLVCSLFTYSGAELAEIVKCPEAAHRTVLIRSFDRGRTWDNHLVRPPSPFLADETDGPMILLKDGSILLTISGAPKAGRPTQAAVFTSHDRGTSWKLLSAIKADHNLDEANATQLPDGRLVLMARPEGDISWSRDQGRAWTSPATFGMRIFAPSLYVLRDGTLVCLHGSYAPGHGGLRLIFSTDGGHTWIAPARDHGFLVDNCYGYGKATELPDGTLLVADQGTGGHTTADAKSMTIRVLRVRVRADHSGIDLLPASNH